MYDSRKKPKQVFSISALRDEIKYSMWLIVITFSCTTTILSAQQAEFIEVLTEATPFTTQGSSVSNTGEATTFVKKVLAEAGIESNIAYTPWRRSYQYALTKPDVLIYPIARTLRRETDFIWVGNIIPVNYFLFKLKSRNDIQLDQIDHAKKYSIGVVDHHAHHEYLISKGFTDLQVVNSSAQNLNKLLRGRIDLFPLSSGGLEPLCQQISVDCKLLEPAVAFEDFSDGLYMAFSINSNPNTIQRVRDSYQKVRASNSYEDLFSHRNSLAQKVEAQHRQSATSLRYKTETPPKETSIEE